MHADDGDALDILLPDGSELSVALADVSFPCVIGRDSTSAQIVIPDSQSSRSHCSLTRHSDGRLIVEDLGSMNGSFINDQRITRAVLGAKDELRIGGTHIRLRPPPPPPDPLVGTTISGYEIQGVLGQGRYGTVYKAIQINLQRPVALKILSAEFRKDPTQIKGFLDEARRAGRLNHPNLVQVHDISTDGDQHLLVMELMSHSLGYQLREDGPLDESEVFDVVSDIAKALAYAEAQGIVHRDVKPDNILATSDGVYKLADLGIAMHMGADGKARQEAVFGSPHYVAPEQARGLAIDGRADLYALGASAWHLLIGKPMYQGSAKQLIAAQVSSPLPDLAAIKPDVTHGMTLLLKSLLEKDPGKRPGKAQDVVELVKNLRTRTSGLVSMPGKRINPARRRRLRRR